MTVELSRRRFLVRSGTLAAGSALAGSTVVLAGCSGSDSDAPMVGVSDAERPKMSSGIQLGDVGGDRAVVWARTDRRAQMIVEYDTTDRFAAARRVAGPTASEATDFTSRVELSGLAPGQSVFVRVRYVDPDNSRRESEAVLGQLRTAPDARRSVRFVWGGDTAGQGWGINTDFGGMKIYETMRTRDPDFFVHSGDIIYADGPITAEVRAEDGRIWKNLVTPEVSKVAETLAEFRGRYAYNLMDANVRAFNAQVPQLWQWDDHEVTNNWSASKDLSGDARYTVKDINTLIARGAQAFAEYAPIPAANATQPPRVYRKISYGPLLDVFVIDMRSFRGPNTSNLQTTESAATALLGNEQVDWLISGLRSSTATWKVIASDMPIGLHVPDGRDAQGNARWEAVANGNDGAAAGRELEIARLLRSIRSVRNVVWITADVHYCAAHFYDPAQATSSDFAGFWEFVAGPLNAGAFGPNNLDKTFGPTVVFQKAPPAANASPYAGYQFFGEVNIDAQSKALTVDLIDLNGVSQFRRTLSPEGV